MVYFLVGQIPSKLYCLLKYVNPTIKNLRTPAVPYDLPLISFIFSITSR